MRSEYFCGRDNRHDRVQTKDRRLPQQRTVATDSFSQLSISQKTDDSSQRMQRKQQILANMVYMRRAPHAASLTRIEDAQEFILIPMVFTLTPMQ
jgi:hypothetical protein